MRQTFARTVLILAMVLSGTVFAPAQTAEESVRTVEIEALIAARIDAARAQAAPNAVHLRSDPDLIHIARARSTALARGAPFSHQDREGRYPAIDMVKARFGPYGYIGENLAEETGLRHDFDADAFARRTVDGWMGSEEHRENILSPDYTTSGIGVAVMDDRAYVTQVFHGPSR